MTVGGMLRRLDASRIFVILAIAVVLAAILIPNFLTTTNVRGLLNQASVNTMIAVGLTLVLIAGHIDLSVGSNLALSGMIAIVLQEPLGVPGAAIAAVTIGGLVGVANGVAVAYLGVSSLLVTLASMIMLKGVALTLAGGDTVSGADIAPSLWIQSRMFELLSPTIIIAIVAVVATQLLLSLTVPGRTLYVIGGSDDGGRMTGIPTRRYLVGVFAASGSFAAAGGVMLSLGLNTGSAYFGDATVFTVIAAVVVGGTSLLGAEGSAIKSAMGVLLLATVTNAFSIRGIPTFVLQVFTGGLLMSVVLLDSYLGLRRRRSWRLRRIAVEDEETLDSAPPPDRPAMARAS